MAERVKILETFRDGVQGLKAFIPTDTKVEIINSLLEVGFDYLDVGSFVSSRIIPQFRDMELVLEQINSSDNKTRLFVLVGNEKGALQASRNDRINTLGYPFSTSETFLKKNINKGFDAAFKSLSTIQEKCVSAKKDLMVYLAMAFGNPYNDPVDVNICLHWAEKLQEIGIKNIHLSDIIGVATPNQIGNYFKLLSQEFPALETGIHLHVKEEVDYNKLQHAYDNGCRIFDGVISARGGCPMTGYEMLNNLSTSALLKFTNSQNLSTQINSERFNKSSILVDRKLAGYFSY